MALKFTAQTIIKALPNLPQQTIAIQFLSYHSRQMAYAYLVFNTDEKIQNLIQNDVLR